MALTPEDAAKARTAARELVDDYAPGAPERVRIAAAELVAERLARGSADRRGAPQACRARCWPASSAS